MTEPWNLRQSDERTADSIPNFIIFCEDGEIEPAYFRAFETSRIKISPIPDSKQHHQQIDKATEYCRKNDLLEVVGSREQLKLDSGAQVWCVYDRDKEVGDGKDSAFSNSINVAESLGIRTAWSNDDFELWVLLHFEDVPGDNPEYKHRQKYYERLTEILKSVNPKTTNEIGVTDNPLFSYYSSMKKKRYFISITLQRMRGKTAIAIEHAKKLESYHATPPKPNHEKSPCTMVHHLVEELIKHGGKAI